MHAFARQTLLMLRGGSQPRDVALAVLLGLLAGFLTGWNLSCVAVLLLAVLFNTHGLLLAACWLSGLGAAWLTQGISTAVGRWLLDETFIGSIVAALGHGPLSAIFGLDQYVLTGGGALGLLIGLPAAVAMFRRTPKHRSLDPLAEKPRTLRPWGWAVTAVAAAGITAAPGWLAPKLMQDELLAELTRFNGAEVTADQIAFDVWEGELYIEGLRLADPAHLTRDRLSVAHVFASVDPGQLLRGRLHIDDLLLESVQRDLALSADTSSNLFSGRFGGSSTYSSGLTTDTSAGQLHEFIENWSQKSARLGELRQLIAAAEELAACEGTQGNARRHALTGGRTSARSELGQSRPRVQIARVRLEQLPSAWGLGSKASIELTGLSSRSAEQGTPGALKIIAPQFAARLTGQLNLHQPGRPHTLHVQAYELQVAELLNDQRCSPYLSVGRGRVSIDANGWATRERIDLALHLDSRDLEVHLTNAATLAGVQPDVWNDSLQRLPRLRLDGTLAGRWSELALVADSAAVRDQLTQQLQAAGEYHLIKRIETPTTVAATTESVTTEPEPTDVAPLVPIQRDVATLTPETTTVTEQPAPETVAVETVATPTEPVSQPEAEAVATATPEPQPVDPALLNDPSELQYPHAAAEPRYLGEPQTPPEPRRMVSVPSPQGPRPGPINLTTGTDPLQHYPEQQAVVQNAEASQEVQTSRYVDVQRTAAPPVTAPATAQRVEPRETQPQTIEEIPTVFSRVTRGMGESIKRVLPPWGNASANVEAEAEIQTETAGTETSTAAKSGVTDPFLARQPPAPPSITPPAQAYMPATAAAADEAQGEASEVIAEAPWYKRLWR